MTAFASACRGRPGAAGVRWPSRRGWVAGLLLLLSGLLAGCSAAGYYGQAVRGHLSLVYAARPIADWLQDPATPDLLKARLRRAQGIRQFAVERLNLPDGASYRSYAALQRAAAVWNVVAAPPYSLRLRRWCYVVAGCVSYRGYYEQARAQALALQLQDEEGLEVQVYGVPAYSTLGRLDWLGGDPLLSTVIARPEGELARLMFHEMAHQRVYAAGDTVFNESYANAVGELGVHQWLREQADDAARQEYERRAARRRQFFALVRETRAELAHVYAEPVDVLADGGVAAAKAMAMTRFRERYAALKQRWAGEGMAYHGYDAWVAAANNASFGLQAAYDDWVPVFKAVYACLDGDWTRFHAVAHALAVQPRAERESQLHDWAQALPIPDLICRDLVPDGEAVAVQDEGTAAS